MSINRNLWSEIWARVAREEIGLYLRFTNLSHARQRLYQHRPPNMRDHAIANAGGIALFILRPGVELNEEYRRNALAQINSDLIPAPVNPTPDLD